MDIQLRPWTEDDIPFLLTHANNPNIAAKMTDAFPSPYLLENAISFLNFAHSHKPNLILAIEKGGQPVGSIGLHPQNDIQRKNTELGYWVAEAYWGLGIASKAVVLMLDYGWKNLETTRIFARPFGNNPASQRVLEKAGFTLEARIADGFFKQNEYTDELIYGIRRTQ